MIRSRPNYTIGNRVMVGRVGNARAARSFAATDRARLVTAGVALLIVSVVASCGADLATLPTPDPAATGRPFGVGETARRAGVDHAARAAGILTDGTSPVAAGKFYLWVSVEIVGSGVNAGYSPSHYVLQDANGRQYLPAAAGKEPLLGSSDKPLRQRERVNGYVNFEVGPGTYTLLYNPDRAVDPLKVFLGQWPQERHSPSAT